MINEETRVAIVVIHKRGIPNPKIVNTLNLKHYEVKRSSTDSRLRTRSRTVQEEETPAKTAKTTVIRKATREFPGIWPVQRKLGKTHGIGKSTVHRVLKEDLKVVPHKDDDQNTKRLENYRIMKRLVVTRHHRQILFSDETVEPARNQQNHGEWLSKGSTRTVNVQTILEGIVSIVCEF